KPAARADGLPADLRVHDLRHTCASLLIREGASIKAVQHHLGHKAASITLDRYGHLFPEELDHLADRPHGPDALVFGMPQGGALRASKWGERYFRPAVRAAGLPEGLRVHDLRHTAASLAIRENASVKIVQAMLGHRSATQTLDRYGHLYADDFQALAERLDAAHAAALAGQMLPQRRPVVAQLRKRPGQ
ncbi:MAG TPA: tyrosine-type recombinase/integrase, partial [Actinomycetota bacterium]|nr:tyrosine-type recombinase/integrase [Actinomycetota bacterium]